MTSNELEWELELQFIQNFWAELEWEWELNFLKKTLTLTLNYLNKMSFNKTTVILNKRFFSIFFLTLFYTQVHSGFLCVVTRR